MFHQGTSLLTNLFSKLNPTLSVDGVGFSFFEDKQ